MVCGVLGGGGGGGGGESNWGKIKCGGAAVNFYKSGQRDVVFVLCLGHTNKNATFAFLPFLYRSNPKALAPGKENGCGGGGGRGIRFSHIFADFCSRGLNHLIWHLKDLGEISDPKVKICLDAKWPVLLYKILIFWKSWPFYYMKLPLRPDSFYF